MFDWQYQYHFLHSKNIQHHFQQGLLRCAWGIEGLLRDWGLMKRILGRLLLSFASSCLFGRSNKDSRSKELLSEPLPTSKVCLAMMILWIASWFPTRNWAMMRLSVLRNLVAGFCVSCILESVVSPLPTPCHGRPSHWHAPELPWPPWLENNLQSLLATSQSTALRQIMGKGALIFWTWGAQQILAKEFRVAHSMLTANHLMCENFNWLQDVVEDIEMLHIDLTGFVIQ